MSDESKLSRRDFIKGAAAGAAVVGAGAIWGTTPAAAQTQCPIPGVPTTWDFETDVLVCGYGTAGMPAAIDARDAGADVLIIEVADWAGGCLRRAKGGIIGTNTAVQKALGVVGDSPDRVYKYMLNCGEGLVDPALLRVVADNCGPNADWITVELGWFPISEWKLGPGANANDTVPNLMVSENLATLARFGETPIERCLWHKADPNEPLLVNKQYRGGNVPGGGTGLYKALNDAITKRAIKSMLETSVVELIATSDREVLGVKALQGGKIVNIRARKGVVLASGTFINNAEMVKNFSPRYIGQSTQIIVPNGSGGGIKAAQAIGADLINMDVSATGSLETGGLHINVKGQVLDVFGKVMPRLYSAPFTAAGTHGTLTPGSGYHIAMSVCFGRVSGKNAASESRLA